MTKNNLSKCLAWLLQETDSFAQVNPEHVIVEPSAFVESEPPTINNATVPASQEVMARLQLAPQSATKSRLLAQAKSVPATPDSNTPRRSSPAVFATASRPQRTPARGGAAAPTKTPTTNYDDSVFDIDDLDELLDDEGHDLTTSSYEDFGTPRKLWTENAASRVEPLSNKKGKKRKSEEYFEDIVQSNHGRTGQSHFQRGYELSQEAGSSRVRDKTMDSISRSATQRQESKSHQTTFHESRSSPKKLQPTEEDISHLIDSSEPQPSQKTIIAVSPEQHKPQKSTGKKQNRAVVPDSDDDDGDVEGNFLPLNVPSQVKVQMPRRQSSVRSSPVRVKESPSLQKTARGAQIEPSQSSLNSSIERLKKSESSGPALAPSPNSGLPASSNPQLSKSESDLVDRYMNLPAAQCSEMLSQLDQVKKATSKEMADQIYEHEFYSEELRDKMRSLKVRIEALQQIIRVRDEYLLLCQKRDSIKTQCADLFAQGLEIGQDTKQNLKLLRTEENDMQVALYHLIVQSGWSQDQSDSGHGVAPSNSGDLTADAHRDVLVASTQHPRIRALGHEVATVPSSSTQPISQTPLGPRNQTQKTDFHHPRDSRNADPVHEYQRSSQRQNYLGEPSRSSNLLHRVSDRDNEFTRTMGSPSRFSTRPTPPIDEFEDAFDDEEAMLHAAEAFDNELNTGKNDEPVFQSIRPVLSSVSGNARRVEPSRQEELMPAPPTKQYPWTKDVNLALRKRFHLKGFRHNQLEAINATLGGKDAFVLMPTGGGKSLCYQLPSIVPTGKTRGVTVVISPLLSLMQDQVDHLQKLKIQAYLMNGESTTEHKNYIYQAFRDPQPERFIQLLYITPEMLGKSQKMIGVLDGLHKRKKLARIVIDEAHCVSQWGHDFRPDYKGLGDVRRNFPGVPVMALTATATENVKLDVIHNLDMDGCEVFNQSFNRPNLSYEVREKVKGESVLDNVADTINTFHRGQSGIVYCLSRKNCESVADQLRNDHGIKAAHYHAGMPSTERIEIQKQWQAGEYDVIVATIAFGMGIDKPDVRFVIHYTVPKSLEGYYQETGRAGRDGLPSKCYLYYGYGDTTQLRRMITTNKDTSWEQQERQLHMLRNVVQYCENKSDCRRFQVLAYFNEHFNRDHCHNTCDNCKSDSTFEEVDFTEQAKEIVSLVQQLNSPPVTLLHCVDVYRGVKTRKMTDAGHDELEEFGNGSDMDRGDLERLFYRLVNDEALQEWHKVNRAGFPTQYIQVGPAARDVLAGKLAVKIQVRASPRPKIKRKAVSKGSRKKKAGGTGVQAAEDFPASTNVSSPIDARKSRHKAPSRSRLQAAEDSGDDEYFEDDLDTFAPVRQAGVALNVGKQSLGPPITSDNTLSALNTAQRNVLDDFTREAARYFRGVILNKGLKQNPVPDSVLREIGINLPRTMNDLAKIRGMTAEKVRLYGPKILDLVKPARETYDLLVVQVDEDQSVQRGRQSIVEITDDDEDPEVEEENFFTDDDLDIDELENTESSHYFSAASDRRTTRPTPIPQSRSSTTISTSKGHRRSGSQSRTGNTARSYRGKTNTKRTSAGKASSTSKVSKRGRNSGPRSNGSTFRNSNSTSKSRGSTTQSNKGNALIGMMPT